MLIKQKRDLNITAAVCCVVSLLVFSTVCIVSAAPADTLYKPFRKDYILFYRINESRIDTLFMGNALTISNLKKDVDSLARTGTFMPDSVRIISNSSPDGNYNYNLDLARRRGETAKSIFTSFYPDINPGILTQSSFGEDWGTLRNKVEEDFDTPDRDIILQLIDSGLNGEDKERKLRSMREAFRYIIDNHINYARSSSVTITFLLPYIPVEVFESDPLMFDTLETESALDLKYRPGVDAHDTRMLFALRSNLLVPGFNIGVEVPVSMNWSIGTDYYYPWWLARNNQRCVEMLAWFVDGKYWFGIGRSESDKLSGHALGVYGGLGYYDFQWLKSGYQGEFTDIGIDYTYSLPVANNRLRFEFNVGIGWIHTVSRHYTPDDSYEDLIKDPGVKHQKLNYLGPSRASVSIVVPILVKYKKGGTR